MPYPVHDLEHFGADKRLSCRDSTIPLSGSLNRNLLVTINRDGDAKTLLDAVTGFPKRLKEGSSDHSRNNETHEDDDYHGMDNSIKTSSSVIHPKTRATSQTEVVGHENLIQAA